EKQGDRSKVADPPGQGPGLQLLRKEHGNLEARDQVLICPEEFPATRDLALLRWRKRVLGEVDLLEVCGHAQGEVADLGYLPAPIVAPALEALGAIADLQRHRSPGRDPGGSARTLAVGGQAYGHIVGGENQIVVNGLFSREAQGKGDVLLAAAGIAEDIGT